jgi:hypothetical protein
MEAMTARASDEVLHAGLTTAAPGPLMDKMRAAKLR